MTNGYQDLIVWKKSFELTKVVYALTSRFPKEEIYGLSAHIRRAAVSIPSNLAEGYRRQSRNEMRQFTRIAFGSAAELETQLMLAKGLQFTDIQEFQRAESLLNDVLRLLHRFHASLNDDPTHDERRPTD